MKPHGKIIFGAPTISETEIDAVVSVLRSQWIGTGPLVSEFENQFREYMGTSHAIALSSCSASLFLSMIAMGIGPGDEVITTDMTFCATANSIIHTGATPVVVDCDRETMNISMEGLESAVGARTRAIIPVHFAGYPCRMSRILELADRHDLKVIEDCAHAIESTIDKKHCGTFGDVGCFSFYATKNITSGEGGMLITDDPDIAERVRVLKNHGLSSDAWDRHSSDSSRHYDVICAGYKSNMTDLQAAIGLGQLKKVEAGWQRRFEMWEEYRRRLEGLPVEVCGEMEEGVRHACHLFTILLALERLKITRDEFMRHLMDRGIGSGIHYKAIHEHSYYRDEFGLSPGDYPNASRISERTVSLPFSPALTDAQIDHILDGVTEILAENSR